MDLHETQANNTLYYDGVHANFGFIKTMCALFNKITIIALNKTNYKYYSKVIFI
jgi:hypothetical protein